MFFKNSRYRRLKDQVVTDKDGNYINEKELRFIPFAEGKYLHTLNEGNRLDHLAHRFYRQSKKWWRICDANNAILSPLSLIGKEPVCFSRFIVTYEGDLIFKPDPEKNGTMPVPPLSIVSATMNPLLERRPDNGEGPREKRIWSIDVSYNKLNIRKEKIKKIIETFEFQVNEIMDIQPFGKKIIVPENTVE